MRCARVGAQIRVYLDSLVYGFLILQTGTMDKKGPFGCVFIHRIHDHEMLTAFCSLVGPWLCQSVQNSYYLFSKKLLWYCGPQVGNFPSLAHCLYCSARNAVVVITLQWLGKTELWSTTWSQTPSDMPSTLPPTAWLGDRKQSEMRRDIWRLEMSKGRFRRE